MHATGERWPPGACRPPPTFLDPLWYRLRVGPGQPAQPRGAPGERFVEFALACALEEAGHLGQQVGPTACERLEFGDCGGFLISGEPMPLRPVPGLPRYLRDEDTVSLRVIIDHAFYSAG